MTCNFIFASGSKGEAMYSTRHCASGPGQGVVVLVSLAKLQNRVSANGQEILVVVGALQLNEIFLLECLDHTKVLSTAMQCS